MRTYIQGCLQWLTQTSTNGYMTTSSSYLCLLLDSEADVMLPDQFPKVPTLPMWLWFIIVGINQQAFPISPGQMGSYLINWRKEN